MSSVRLACAWLVLASWAVGPERTRQSFRPVAERMVAAINAADYQAVRQDFNRQMRQAFPVPECKQFFQGISREFGKITKLGAPRFKSADTAEFVARCERGALDFTLVLDGQGRVSAMRFVPHSDLPVPEKNQTPLGLPFRGRWLVIWGGDTAELNHHHDSRSQRFAFDLVGVGDDGKTHRGGGGRNEDYYAFGRELLAPADGVVTEVIDGVRDNTPGSMNPLSALGNAVFVRHGTHEVSVLAHLQQGSSRVKVGQKVRKGQVIGRCGNSGNSSEPHLHYHLQNTPVIQDATGIKCYFEELAVDSHGTHSLPARYSPVKGDILVPLAKSTPRSDDQKRGM